MRKVYHMSTCSTCRRIINDLELKDKGFIFQDLKKESISESELDQLAKMAGSYENLFSRRAKKYKEWGLDQKELTEDDFRSYLFQENRFLKRPIIVIEDRAFVGNSKSQVEAARTVLSLTET